MAWSKQQEAIAEVSYWKPQQEFNTEFNVFQADVFQNDVFQVSGVGVTWESQQEAA